MALTLRVVSHSEIGLVRKNNQDSGYATPHLLVVADGMGGAAAGDLASAVAVDTLMRLDASEVSGPAMLETIGAAVATANDRIADLVEADNALDGMGTTVTAALFDGAELGLVHIGDSRAYLFRDGGLSRLTHDDSWVQSLVDEGKISEEEAAVHPHRSLLLKVLNGQASSEPALRLVEVRPGDRLMFCSDGLCGLIDDPEIAALLTLSDRADALDALVGAARAEGGVDNITVIVADVVEPGAGATDDEESTPVEADSRAVLGAAAERSIPPAAGEATERGELTEDTAVNARVPALAAPPAAAPPVPTPAEDEARYNPRPPTRRRFVRPLLGVLVLLLVVGVGLGAAYAWTRTQYYVGVAGEKVAIYRGLSDSLPGLSLSTLYEVQPLTVAELPPYYQEKVRGAIDVSSLGAARDTVDELREAAARCVGTTPKPTPAPKPSTSPRSSPSAIRGTPSASAGATTGPGC